jgi:transposase
MAEKHEVQLRRQAIRLWVQGVKSKDILQQVQRSRVWLSKWRKRFEQDGVQGLRSHSRRPHTTPQAYPPRIVHLIIRTRRRLVKQAVGLSGPRAI